MKLFLILTVLGFSYFLPMQNNPCQNLFVLSHSAMDSIPDPDDFEEDIEKAYFPKKPKKNKRHISNCNEKSESSKKYIASLCEYFSEEKDDFSNKKTIYSPFIVPRNDFAVTERMGIVKIIENAKPYYYLSLTTYGSTLNIGEKGVSVLFLDKTILFKDSKIDVNFESLNYKYAAFVPITYADVKKFASMPVDKIKLYIYDYDLTDCDAERFKMYASCMLNKE